MRKRIISAFLWFYGGWYAGALVAEFFHISPMLGPILGAALAAVFAGDPRHVIWKAADAVTIKSGADTTQETA